MQTKLYILKQSPLTFSRMFAFSENFARQQEIVVSKFESIIVVGWLDGFNVRLERRRLTIADGLGVTLEDGLETCHHSFDLPRRGWLPRFGIPSRDETGSA